MHKKPQSKARSLALLPARRHTEARFGRDASDLEPRRSDHSDGHFARAPDTRVPNAAMQALGENLVEWKGLESGAGVGEECGAPLQGLTFKGGWTLRATCHILSFWL